MEDIIEEFGLGFLQIVAGAALVVILGACFLSEGVVSNMVVNYLYGICG